jgi:hypothetical protein
MNIIDKTLFAIQKINPNLNVTIGGEKNSTLEELTIIFENGNAIPKEQILAIIPQVELDMAMETLRAKRNKLLADTDYTVLQDSTFTDAQVAEWVVYRQALRDITNGLTTKDEVEAVVFPTKP